MRRKLLLIGGPIALVLLITGLFSYVRLRQASSPQRPQKAAAPAVAGDGASLNLPGRVEAAEVVPVPVPIDGTVDWMPVTVGENVYEGQLLARIRDSGLELDRDAASAELNRTRTRVSNAESSSIAANMEAARANEAAARARADADRLQKAWARQQMLFSEGAAAKLAVEAAHQEYEAAGKTFETLNKAALVMQQRASDLSKELDQAQKALTEKTQEHEDTVAQVASGEVVSPVDGMVVARRGQPGEAVTIELENMFEIAVNIGNLRAVVELPPAEMGKVRPGQEALIHLAELPNPIAAKVTEVHDNQVRIDFVTPTPVVKPGLSAQVVIKLK